MKINDIKHNHSLTDLLKVGIFSILMCAPLIAIGTTCAYAIVNKNAVESYGDKYVTTTQTLTNTNQFVENQNIIANYKEVTGETTVYGAYIKYNSISINWTDYGFADHNYNQFRLFNNGTIQLKDTNGTQYTESNKWGNTLKTFTFNFNSITDTASMNGGVSYVALFYSQQTLDNAFYYATEKMTQSDLFNWTQNTAIYTGVSAMCTQLDIETNVIPILIVYWFILTIIYVIIDIVLKCFTTLTHMISKEAH